MKLSDIKQFEIICIIIQIYNEVRHVKGNLWFVYASYLSCERTDSVNSGNRVNLT